MDSSSNSPGPGPVHACRQVLRASATARAAYETARHDLREKLAILDRKHVDDLAAQLFAVTNAIGLLYDTVASGAATNHEVRLGPGLRRLRPRGEGLSSLVDGRPLPT